MNDGTVNVAAQNIYKMFTKSVFPPHCWSIYLSCIIHSTEGVEHKFDISEA